MKILYRNIYQSNLTQQSETGTIAKITMYRSEFIALVFQSRKPANAGKRTI
ncbi:MAG: hypothetical protein FWH07_07855 [Oscillospiraceae bacterium]|nr:hypothetical protein [Oscillospiraceae bacterium]